MIYLFVVGVPVDTHDRQCANRAMSQESSVDRSTEGTVQGGPAVEHRDGRLGHLPPLPLP